MRAMIFVVGCFAAVGCAHRVAVESEPPGAQVYLNNVELGTTPLVFDEPDDRQTFELRLEKAGYVPKNTVLMPVETGTSCLLASPWRAKLPDQLYFQLYPAATTD
jgi:hypothetical protein